MVQLSWVGSKVAWQIGQENCKGKPSMNVHIVLETSHVFRGRKRYRLHIICIVWPFIIYNCPGLKTVVYHFLSFTVVTHLSQCISSSCFHWHGNDIITWTEISFCEFELIVWIDPVNHWYSNRFDMSVLSSWLWVSAVELPLLPNFIRWLVRNW